jgi:HEPN domain-containing protein
MNQEQYIKLWLSKADGDLKVAKRELECDDPVLDAVCFHLQQAVEKYLKAFLSKSQQKITKTHNLEFLIQQCIQIDEEFSDYEEEFDSISECGVEIRYPDSFITLESNELREDLSTVGKFRSFIRKKLLITE